MVLCAVFVVLQTHPLVFAFEGELVVFESPKEKAGEALFRRIDLEDGWLGNLVAIH